MQMFLPLIILVILGCVFAGSLKTPKSRLTVVVSILAIILILCYLQIKTKHYEGFNGNSLSGYAPLGYTMTNGGSGGNVGIDGQDSNVQSGRYNYGDINSQIGPSGTYDGLKLKSQIATNPLINDVTIFNNVGDGYVLKDSMNSEKFPTIDGQPNSPKSMFVLKNNAVSWDCCPSTFGAGMNGCVCPSKEQLDMFAGRSGNRTQPVEYPGM
jgi:hypothetical protein